MAISANQRMPGEAGLPRAVKLLDLIISICQDPARAASGQTLDELLREITCADGTSAAVSSERQETEGLRGDIERLRNRGSELERTVLDLNVQLQEERISREAAEQDSAEARGRLDKQVVAFRGLEREVEQARTLLTQSEVARRDGEKEREELRARLGAVQRELAEADALRLEASSSGTETQERLTQAQRHAQAALKRQEEAERKLEQQVAQFRKLEREAQQAKAQLAHSEGERTRLLSGGRGLEGRVLELQSQVEALQREKVQAEAGLADAQARLQDDALGRVRVELEEAVRDREALTVRVRALEAELEARMIPCSVSPTPRDVDVDGLDSVLVLELGSWHMRCGLIGTAPALANSGASRAFVSLPSVLARPKNGQADLQALVQNASLQAGHMYRRFRDEGVFVGQEAWYCCYDHPDPALRASLKLECPFNKGQIVLEDDVGRLIRSAAELLDVDVSTKAVVVTYKPHASPKERQKIAEVLFETFEAPMVRFFNEAYLLAEAAKSPTALILDIGHDVTRVVPMYEGMVVDTAVRTSSLGGRDLTEFMSDMLLSRKNEVFSTLVPRKQLEAARRLKERHCYVALDFDKEVESKGKFSREKIDVMNWRRSAGAGAVEGSGRASAVRGGGADVGAERVTLEDGDREAELVLDRERFHCPELLYTPGLRGEEKGAGLSGIVDVLMESLRSLEVDLWEDVLGHLLLAGASSLFPGMAQRLAKELRARLPDKFARVVRVLEVERESRAADADQSAVWRGAEAVVPRLLKSNRADEWLSGDTYRDTGPAAADDVRYTGSM